MVDIFHEQFYLFLRYITSVGISSNPKFHIHTPDVIKIETARSIIKIKMEENKINYECSRFIIASIVLIHSAKYLPKTVTIIKTTGAKSADICQLASTITLVAKQTDVITHKYYTSLYDHCIPVPTTPSTLRKKKNN